MSQQTVSAVFANVPGVGTSPTPEYTDYSIGDLSADAIETTYQLTSAAGASAFRTFEPSILKNPGSIRLTMLYAGQSLSVGATTSIGSPMTIKLDRATDIEIFRGHVFLESVSPSGNMGENMTVELTFKMTGNATFGESIAIGATS